MPIVHAIADRDSGPDCGRARNRCRSVNDRRTVTKAGAVARRARPLSLRRSSSPPAQPAATQPGSPAPQPPAPKVDESALRYFASRGDKARLQAEISRLQALYPNWVPPADPLAIPQGGDKQLESMWQLYSEGRYAELRKAIADRQIGR
jgi:hypothetical protein